MTAKSRSSTLNYAKPTLNPRKPHIYRSETDEGTEARSQFVVPSGYASKLLEPAKESLDNVAILVLGHVHGTASATVRQLRYDCLRAKSLDVVHYIGSVVGLVCGHAADHLVATLGRRVHEVDSCYRVVNVTSSELEGSWPSLALYRGVNLCGEAAP